MRERSGRGLLKCRVRSAILTATMRVGDAALPATVAFLSLAPGADVVTGRGARTACASRPQMRRLAISATISLSPGIQEETSMDWHERITSDPDTLFGKPRIKGTRIGVDFILDLLASGWSEARILDNYPHLKQEDLQAVFAFVRDCLKDETFIMNAALKPGEMAA